MARQRNLYRKKLEKILKKIDILSSKGKDQELQFIKYVNELLEKGDYSAFVEVLFIYYNIDVSDSRSVSEHLKSTWKGILEQTKSNFTKRLSNIFKSFAKKYNLKEIYQLGLDVYIKKNDDSNIFIGRLIETESFTDESQYHIKNKQYARLIGDRKTNLEVELIDNSKQIITSDYNSIFNITKNVSKITGDENVVMSQDFQLIEIYKESLEILLNQAQLSLNN